MYVTMFTMCLDFGSNKWEISAWLPSWHQCIVCVYILSLYATRWPVVPSCMQLTLVSWYVASKLCCHCWMFTLSDACQSYPSKLWFRFCVAMQISARHNLFVFYSSIFLHEIIGISWLTLWKCWLHSCWMFILLAEYGLVHSGDV